MSGYSSFLTLLVFMAMPSHPLRALDQFEIRPDQVADAMRQAGWRVTAGQVHFLTNVVAAVREPQLRVESFNSWGERRMRVRFACSRPEVCLPFFVSITDIDLGSVTPLQNSQVPTSPPIAPTVRPSSTAGARAGSTATLLIDSDRTHIRVPVVCLESGMPGQVIRVESKDHRRTFVAEVIDHAFLKGKM